MRQMSKGRAGLRVLPNPCDRVEIRRHTQRVGPRKAALIAHTLVKPQQVQSAKPVRVSDENLVEPMLQEASDSSIDLLGQQHPPSFVAAAAGKTPILRIENARAALHIRDQEQSHPTKLLP